MTRLTGDDSMLWIKGMLKKAASGVLALLPCSRTESTLRASKGLRPCWTDFFEQFPPIDDAWLLWSFYWLWEGDIQQTH